jgi:hypothetical protein
MPFVLLLFGSISEVRVEWIHRVAWRICGGDGQPSVLAHLRRRWAAECTCVCGFFLFSVRFVFSSRFCVLVFFLILPCVVNFICRYRIQPFPGLINRNPGLLRTAYLRPADACGPPRPLTGGVAEYLWPGRGRATPAERSGRSGPQRQGRPAAAPLHVGTR